MTAATRADAMAAAPGARSGSLKRALGLLLAGVLGIVYAVWFGQAFDIAHLRNDATQYIVVARHLQAGDGAVTSLQTYPAQQSGPPPVAQRVWPPGYPMALAAVSSLSGLPAEWIATPFALWCLFMVGALIAFVGRDAGLPWPAAVGAALVWFALPEPLMVAGGGQSESFFNLLVMSALAILAWRARVPLSIGWSAAAMAGLCFAAAFMIRYNGIAFVAALAVMSALTVLVQRRLHPLALVGAIPAVVAVAQLVGNWLATGSVRAGSHNRGDLDVTQILESVQFGLRAALGLDASWPYPAPAMLAIGAVAAWLLVSTLRTAQSASLASRACTPIRRVASWSIPWVCAGLAGSLVTMHLVFTIMGGRTYPFEARYLVAALPLALIAAAAGIAHCHRLCAAGRDGGLAHGRNETASGASRAKRTVTGWIIAALVIWASALVAAWQDRGLPFSPPARAEFAIVRDALAQPAPDGQSLGEWLRAQTDARHGLLAADGQVLGMLLERPVAALTTPEYTNEIWTPENARALACRVGARWLIVFPELLQEQSRTRPPQDVIARLAGQDVPSGWSVVLETPLARILNVCDGAPRGS